MGEGEWVSAGWAEGRGGGMVMLFLSSRLFAHVSSPITIRGSEGDVPVNCVHYSICY